MVVACSTKGADTFSPEYLVFPSCFELFHPGVSLAAWEWHDRMGVACTGLHARSASAVPPEAAAAHALIVTGHLVEACHGATLHAGRQAINMLPPHTQLPYKNKNAPPLAATGPQLCTTHRHMLE